MRASSVRATADAIVTSGDEPDQDLDTSLDQWVREPSDCSRCGVSAQSGRRTPSAPF